MLNLMLFLNACCSVHLGSKGNYCSQLNVHFLVIESFFIIYSTSFGPHEPIIRSLTVDFLQPYVFGLLCFIPCVLFWCFATSLFHGQSNVEVGYESDLWSDHQSESVSDWSRISDTFFYNFIKNWHKNVSVLYLYSYLKDNRHLSYFINKKRHGVCHTPLE
jgi:hypothetical protein